MLIVAGSPFNRSSDNCITPARRHHMMQNVVSVLIEGGRKEMGDFLCSVMRFSPAALRLALQSIIRHINMGTF